MDEKNLLVLDELNKGCSMGIDALSVILDKAEDKEFKQLIFDLLNKYDKLSNKIKKLYDSKTDDEVKETSTMSKILTWYGVQIRTITDNSTSKLSELTMQGLNMGIIDGRKLLNSEKVDSKVTNLLNEYVDIQEKYVEEMKKYL